MNDHRDHTEGERRKADAHALLEARREVYVSRGRRALLRSMLDGDGRASADDVRGTLDLPPELDPRCLGAVPGRLAYDRIIASDGFTRSTRPEGHARWVQVWRLLDRAAAEQWLADHPDLADPDEGEGPADGSQRLLFPIQSTNDTGAAVAAAAPGEES